MSGTTSETPAPVDTTAVPEVVSPAAPAPSGRSRASQAAATSAVDAAVLAAVQSATAEADARSSALETELAAVKAQLAAALAQIPAPVVTPPVPTGTVTVTNTTGYVFVAYAPKSRPGASVLFGHGTTKNVPSAYWAEWLAEHASMQVVESGGITATASAS